MTHPHQGSPTKYALSPNKAKIRESRDQPTTPKPFITHHLLDLKTSLLEPLFKPVLALNPMLQGVLGVASLLLLWPIYLTIVLVLPPVALLGAAVYVWLWGLPALKADLEAAGEQVFGLSSEVKLCRLLIF